MRWPVVVFVCSSALAQSLSCVAQHSRIPQFTVTNVSRLHALATLGRVAHSSLLVEAGDLHFLQEPVTISENRKSFDELVHTILAGREDYAVMRKVPLNIIYPRKPGKPRNRILTLHLGQFSFKDKTLPALDGELAFAIAQVTGCHRQGYAIEGFGESDIPNFDLRSATFQLVVQQVAKAPTPTMWVVLPDSGERGCISDAGNLWQVGTYNKYTGSPFAFEASIGPQLVR
jgi:hypothetical protein